MAREYDTYVDDLSILKEGEEITIAIRELDIFRTRVVKAIVSSSKEALPDGDTLWLRWNLGDLRPEPWAIKVLEEVPGLLTKEGIGQQ